MATKTGAIGSNGSSSYVTKFTSPKSIGVTMASGEYPTKITLSDLKSGSTPHWFNAHYSNTLTIRLYLCDSNGNNRVKIGEWDMSPQTTDRSHKTFTVSGATALAGKALYLMMTNTEPSSGWDSRDYTVLRYKTAVSVQTAYNQFSVTARSNGNGTLAASANPATVGSTVTLTATPATGYELQGYTTSPAGLTITNNKFTMPAQAVTVTATFRKIDYSITGVAIPSGGGTVTVNSTAQMGDTVSVSQTPAEGYAFDHWNTYPDVTITNGQFTMPASVLLIQAVYLHRSTATISSDSMTGGGSVTLNISAESTAFMHQYKLSFGTNMETNWIGLASPIRSISISIPEAWSNYIPDAEQKTGGTLTLRTYKTNEGGLIGEYVISGLTYNVPASAVPTIGTITKSVARTINGTTYANIGDLYTQLHCGVEVAAGATGALGSTVEAMRVIIGGYSGADYDGTVSDDEIDFTSGLLIIAGETLITVMAIDSRGRISRATTTINVTPYSAPAGTLAVKRVDYAGDDDDTGQYAKYTITKSYTNIGSNSLTASLTSQGSTGTLSLDTGDILPGTGNRQTFSTQQEFIITLTLADAFETVTVTAKLRSAKFIIYANAAGDKLSFMKAANKTIPTGKNATIEFSGDAQIYIGDSKLEEMISGPIADAVSTLEGEIGDAKSEVEGELADAVDDLEDAIDGAVTSLQGEIADSFNGAVIVQDYDYTYGAVNAGDYKAISATNFGIAAKQGYTMAGILGYYTGSYNMFPYRLAAVTSGTVATLRNIGTAASGSTSAMTISVLWVRDDLLPQQRGGLMQSSHWNDRAEPEQNER